VVPLEVSRDLAAAAGRVFVLDWWYLSKSDATGWSPPGWYLLVPLVALGNFVVPVIATPILTVGGGCYLIKRSRMVGTPGLGV
jgi:hypothetical protein